jgi:hypothetical protein
MTYDSFHKNADRIYCVSKPDIFHPEEMTRRVPYPLAGYLQKTFPEIVRSTTILSSYKDYTVEHENVSHTVDIVEIDSSFLEMFDIKLVEGSMDFLIPRSLKIAITREKALQMFGNESPVGKVLSKVYGYSNYTICAVVTGLPKRSNYPFDILMTPNSDVNNWFMLSGENALIELAPNIDVKAFEKKLYEHTVAGGRNDITKMILTPLTAVRYIDKNIPRDVKFQHIIIFAVVGLLLILSTLFNYLTLFVSRFRIRQREFALRTVYGASNRSLFTMLSVEFLLSLVAALLLGVFLIEAIMPSFVKISGIRTESLSIYFESLIYITGVVTVSLLTFILSISILRRRTLNAAIRGGNKKLFRKISIVTQLVVSIGFAFCSIVIVKQMYYLHNTDLGFAFKDRGSVILTGRIGVDLSVLYNKMQQIPEITETVRCYSALIPNMRDGLRVSQWDEQPENPEPVSVELQYVSEQFLKYYDIKVIEGETLSDKDAESLVLINEAMAKTLGWHKSAGKSFVGGHNVSYKVKGVIKNIYSSAPTVPAKPALYSVTPKNRSQIVIMFKYNKDKWKSCKEKIEAITKAGYPDNLPAFYNMEEEYDKFLKSENALLKILSLVSLVCMIVCVFGFVSMVSLTCEERRKEIAIRKIHGATIKDILDIFFKEYLLLLIVGALVAFPAGYLIMKPWLENYVLQTEISAWIYATILLALIMAIVFCVGRKVYRTSRENPAETVKKF